MFCLSEKTHFPAVFSDPILMECNDELQEVGGLGGDSGNGGDGELWDRGNVQCHGRGGNSLRTL